MNPMRSADWNAERTIDDLETLLLALAMHPMFYRQSFKILRYNLRAMKTDGLTAEIVALKERFAVMPDDQLFAAWGALHNPFRLEDRTLN
jgi:hypothetical protein